MINIYIYILINHEQTKNMLSRFFRGKTMICFEAPSGHSSSMVSGFSQTSSDPLGPQFLA